MSETLCTLRTKGGGGGRYTETSLWTNSAPTSNFNAQTVTLSDSLSNYKYVAIDYCYNTSNTNITGRAIYDVADFKNAVKDNSTNHTISALSIEGANNLCYARPVFYVSDTSIAFALSSTLNGSGTYAQGTIPLEILGLNELDHGTALSSFSITGASYASSYYHTSAATTDSSLMAVSASNSQTSSYTVLRNAKGKVYFNYGMRGTVSTYGTIKIGGTTYRPDQYRGSAQIGIEVEFSANDTITVTCGISTYCYEVTMWFVEEK